jgi:hypothetical protein
MNQTNDGRLRILVVVGGAVVFVGCEHATRILVLWQGCDADGPPRAQQPSAH